MAELGMTEFNESRSGLTAGLWRPIARRLGRVARVMGDGGISDATRNTLSRHPNLDAEYQIGQREIELLNEQEARKKEMEENSESD